MENIWDGDTYVYNGGTVHRKEKQKIIYVKIPSFVKQIHQQAFEQCRSLIGVEFVSTSSDTNNNDNNENDTDSMLEEIGNRAFFECSALAYIRPLPSSLKRIGKKAFFRCKQLIIKDREFLSLTSLQRIGGDAFYQCQSLTDVILPNSIERLEKYAFGYCRSLTSVKFSEPSQIKEVGCYTLCGCIALEDVWLPDSATVIAKEVFAYCQNLKRIRLPNSLKRIGKCSFRSCNSLEHIDIPASVTEIGVRAFFTSGLKSIHFHGDNIQELCRETFERCVDLVAVELPPTSIRKVGKHAFVGCKSLTRIRLSNSIQIIDHGAFCGCSNLSVIDFSEPTNGGIASDGERSYYIHHKVDDNESAGTTGSTTASQVVETSISLPSTLERIEKNSFHNCAKLSHIINDENAIVSLQFFCAVNRGGRRFVKHIHDNDDNNNNFVALWPYILEKTTKNYQRPIQERASVVYYLLLQIGSIWSQMR